MEASGKGLNCESGAMNHRMQSFRRPAITGVLALCLFAGCSTPDPVPKSETRDKAFILYWPPDSSNKRLRFAVKDNIDMKGVPTTAGSEYLARLNRPAKRDADCLAGARARGVQFVGKTNLAEFALGTSGMNDYFGTPRNPLDRKRIPGGSSSGSAVVVARGEADVALGTDTAGSVRVPAACCGVLGLKTTFGLVPLRGVVPLSPANLDTVGPMAADIPHLVEGMDLLTPGFAGRYRQTAAAKSSGRSIRVGRLYVKGTNPAIDRSVDAALAAARFSVVRLDERFEAAWKRATDNGSTVAVSDGWVYDQQYLGQAISPITAAAIRLGSLQFRTGYEKAIAERKAWREVLRQTFRKVDVIALPTLQTLPPRKGILTRTALLEQRVLDSQNTVAVNYAGNPALAVPVPMEGEKMPTSVQLIGRPRSEAELVNAARIIREAIAARHARS